MKFVLSVLMAGMAMLFPGFAIAAIHDDVVSAEPQPVLMNARISAALRSCPSAPVSTSARMRTCEPPTSAISPDTVFVGFTPGHSSDNWWSIWSGSDKFHDGGPYHRPPQQGGMWDFEGPYAQGDSLQGWVPVRNQMSGTGGLTIPDAGRPWRCIDYGNEANAVIPGTSRTGGVVGVWHVDRGDLQGVASSVDDNVDAINGAGLGVGGVNWTPLVGGSSAWMGLRRHGDNTHVDDLARGGTGNPFNEDVMMFNALAGAVSLGGTDKRFPGYGDQMDQLLYRDVDVAGVGTLTVGFSYRTAMSTGVVTNNITRSGWFQWDPLVVRTGGSNPNFIESTANPTPPADSFMVYVGAPAESAVVLSDGATHPIFDKKRRWAGEVIRGNEGLYTQILSRGGTVGPITFSATVSAAELDRITASPTAGVADVVRLVFRVKTNQTFSDESVNNAGSTSSGAGAAIVDNVTIQKDGGASTLVGGFESPSEINNATDFGPYGNRSHATHPLNVWKSTGKPTKVYTHVHPLAGDPGRGYIPLVYQDLCGQPGNPARICDMIGVVASTGDHDNFEASGGTFGTAEQEPFDGMMSPTISLVGQGYTTRIINGVVTPVNSMGLSAADADASEDYYIDYEMYTGRFNIFTTGSAWRFGFMVYPAGVAGSQTGQYKRWSTVRYPGCIYFNPDPQCFRNLDAVKGNGLIRTTNVSGTPDSIKIFVGPRQEAYRFGIPVSENFDGCYWDNISLAIVDDAALPPLMVDIWHPYQDTFPANLNDGLVGFTAAFDTTTALLKSGINISPVTGNTSRFTVPGDTTVVLAEGTNVRVDLVFRILPGPGNYTNPESAPGLQVLKRLPNAGTPVSGAVMGSQSFWENYMFDRGAKGAGTHPSPQWSPQVWNSARMDTSEVNVFQQQKRTNPQPMNSGQFMTAYHEDELIDPNRRALAIPRNICFIADTATASSTQAVICGSGAVPVGATYPPAWSMAAGAGLARAGSGDPLASPTQIQSCPGPAGAGLCRTLEGTKILPDGLFTPGTHITYFFRREDLPPAEPSTNLVPDTSMVFPQPAERSTDGHRWQEFSVLPDRWKDSDYIHPVLGTPGSGEACVLFVDNNDRRGNERVFMGMADSIGMTSAAKRGGSNGWSAAGDADVNDPTYFVRKHVGQAGTLFDKYDIKASESLTTNTGSLGSRIGFSNPGNTQIDGKRSRQGPSPTMLTSFYKVLFTVTGDLNSSIWGPFNNKSSNDAGIMTSFATSGDPAEPNRGFYTIGDGWNEAATGAAYSYITSVLGADLVNVSYLHESGSTALDANLIPTSALPSVNGNLYGVRNACTFTLDVQTPVLPEAVVSMNYEDPSGNNEYPAGIFKPHTALRPWIALSDGFDIEVLSSPGLNSSRGRLHYYYHALQDAFGSIAGCNIVGQPLVTTDTPNNGSGRLYNFMSLRNNPVRSGYATFAIGLAQADHVKVKIFDVAGRLVRTLADRRFTAGEHALAWDGADNAGKAVARGVYFAKLEYATQKFASQGKLVLLK